MVSDLKQTMEQISRDKGIDREILIGTLEEAIRSAARKKYGSRFDLEISFNDERGELEVFQFKEVVENVENPDVEISLEDAYKLDPECEIGDSLGMKMDMAEFGRIAAQSAKQVIIQRMKDAEREMVFEDYKDRKPGMASVVTVPAGSDRRNRGLIAIRPEPDARGGETGLCENCPGQRASPGPGPLQACFAERAFTLCHHVRAYPARPNRGFRDH